MFKHDSQVLRHFDRYFVEQNERPCLLFTMQSQHQQQQNSKFVVDCTAKSENSICDAIDSQFLPLILENNIKQRNKYIKKVST
jgi:hypothetical protein